VHLSNTRDVYDTSLRTVGHSFTRPEETTMHDTICNPTEGRRIHLEPAARDRRRSARVNRQATGTAVPAI